MEKIFLSEQVAEETGLSAHTLRYYEQTGVIHDLSQDENGYRQYSRADTAWFQVIKYKQFFNSFFLLLECYCPRRRP
ncbi:MerR family transcriptional regulator [Paenibacillus sonchi]|uniref:MerR family transcriptional regulator n=1 Tax=Paenibacillus sonchi TaxID=373687 RepID=UPI001E31B74C|nr:MerR family transcriptional regulator [Paenibacillus sonchi]MCE3202697.1 MerR family transcriptional regulator [Paenibacillus sonchi]